MDKCVDKNDMWQRKQQNNYKINFGYMEIDKTSSFLVSGIK